MRQYFELFKLIASKAKLGDLKNVDEAVVWAQRAGHKVDDIVRKGIENVFKKGKARDPDFGGGITKLPIDDMGTPFNPNTLKSTLQKRSGVGNLFKETKDKAVKFYDDIVEESTALAKRTGKDVRGLIEERIGYKFTGKESMDDIITIVREKFFKADGGRIGFNQGGWSPGAGRVGYDIGGLTGQAKNIYDSWISAGHSEEDVLAYLESRGMYNAPVIQEGIMTAPNIINQNLGGNGNDGGTTINRYDPNQNLGPNKDITDYEADAYGIGPTWSGQFARLKNAYNKIPTPFNIVRMGIQKAQDWADQRRAEKAAEKAAAAEALQAQITNQANITARDLVAGGASRDYGKTETRDSSGWESSPFKKGGLATMFTRKR